MPYSLSPPDLARASNRDTSWPSTASRCAQASPAGPAPTTATRLPVGAARSNGCTPAAISVSVAWRCRRPISTGRPSASIRTQASSHSVSVGHTRAHMPPRMFCSKMVRAAASGVPVWICRMKSGMSISVGHAAMHGASWQK